MGPFYCPADQKIYLDTAFFDELAQRFGAPGDFAQAYVIAHEVGHHVQNLHRHLDRIRPAQAAGARARAMRSRSGWSCRPIAMPASGRRASGRDGAGRHRGRAARRQAIGDDTLQRAGQGRVVPESFTHGSSAQRRRR